MIWCNAGAFCSRVVMLMYGWGYPVSFSRALTRSSCCWQSRARAVRCLEELRWVSRLATVRLVVSARPSKVKPCSISLSACCKALSRSTMTTTASINTPRPASTSTTVVIGSGTRNGATINTPAAPPTVASATACRVAARLIADADANSAPGQDAWLTAAPIACVLARIEGQLRVLVDSRSPRRPDFPAHLWTK